MALDEVEHLLMRAETTQETENSLDRLFLELDGMPADGQPARILGIHDDGHEWWIQIARGDDDLNTIVLRLSHFAGVFQASAALTRWKVSGSTWPRVVRAMCVA